MSIQEVPVSEAAEKLPKSSFHLIKSVAMVQARKSCFSWLSGRLCESAILIFFLKFALQWNIVILRSLHRYGEYWRPRSKSDCRYFGIYIIIIIYHYYYYCYYYYYFHYYYHFYYYYYHCYYYYYYSYYYYYYYYYC